jgi:hypothetical protein
MLLPVDRKISFSKFLPMSKSSIVTTCSMSKAERAKNAKQNKSKQGGRSTKQENQTNKQQHQKKEEGARTTTAERRLKEGA